MKDIPLREDIPRLYLEEKLSTPQIAKKVGLSVGAVGSILRARGVKLRTAKEGVAVRFPNGAYGELASHWQGGRHKQKTGYVMVYAPNHPRSGRYNRTFEHIIVAEKTLGRYLTMDEVVHHLNGDKQDNRPENLEVLLRKDHVHAHHIKGTRITALHDEIKRLQLLLDEHNIKY